MENKSIKIKSHFNIMVHSRIHDEINYPETKTLDKDDKNYDASLYEISVLGNDVIIALGQSKYLFIDQNVIYYPVYLVMNQKVHSQIGVYEITSSNLPNIIDEEGDIELEKIDQPLLYSFTTKQYLENILNNSTKKDNLKENEPSTDTDTKDPQASADTDTKENEPSADTADTVDTDTKENEPSADTVDTDTKDQEPSADTKELQPSVDMADNDVTLPKEQTREVTEKELTEFKVEKGQPWIQAFLKSNEYTLLDNEGGGDCLFATIRDALLSLGKDITVAELRNKLANEVTEEVYENYKEKYTLFSKSVKTDEIELKRLSKINNELRDRLKNTKDRDEQLKIIGEAKTIADTFKSLKKDVAISKEMLQEFHFMSKVTTMDEFKKLIKTCEFWGDTWAISTLERVLNIKLIIFSSENYKEGDTSNVLQCGQLNDTILEEIGKFEPDYYILLDHTGIHYKLIAYKYHKVFTFPQIPYTVKLLISSKCLERLAGPYYIIPQFRIFNEEIGISEPIEDDIIVIAENPNELYDNNMLFQFYIKSNGKPLPGKGVGEKIDYGLVKSFSELAEIPDWRRKLDNEYTSEFELDGHKWKSVEHYYQGSKFKKTNKPFYMMFSLDSESKISKDVDIAKSAGSKSGKHKSELLRPKEIKIDPDFYGGINEKTMEDAMYAKFSQNIELKKMLMATKKAKLLHFVRGSEPEVANKLMLVRSRIQSAK